jgi:hypothetical protein
MKCNICGIKLNSSNNVTKGFDIHGGKLKYYCERCSKSNSTIIDKLKKAVGFMTKKEKAIERKNKRQQIKDEKHEEIKQV